MLRVIRLRHLVHSPFSPSLPARAYNYSHPDSQSMDATEQKEETVVAQQTESQETDPPQPKRKLAPLLTRTSRTLSYLLRHGSQKEGLKMRPDGYVRVDELLKLPKLRAIGFVDLETIVRNDQKDRYNLIFEPTPSTYLEATEAVSGPVWWIRANQGHSLQEIEVEMKPVTDPSQCPIVIHGTNKRAWESIKRNGLSRMKRNHIHFAQGLPGMQGVISGMRASADIMIYIDLAKALRDSYKFFISANNVVLCSGNDAGFLPPEYFLRVETAWKNYPLPGYELAQERSGKAKLEEFDLKDDENMVRMGMPKRGKKFKWEDPIRDLLGAREKDERGS